MWCYQKPGFEALLLAELQRQQQCSQFCDTLLRTNGVSVPAHSCILSAISPRISSALSSTPPPPAGQSRLLEFRSLGGCTLLHMVRLLYCGEMAGEGEKEKQEAISAAARLGIHGLVEVTRRDCKRRREEGEGRLAEVGVQTEPEENEEWRGGWRREVNDRGTFLWKETLSEGGRDTWTQTEELQASTAPPSQPEASYQTIDIATLQILGETNPTLLLPQIPYIPVSLPLPSSDPMEEAIAAGHTSVAHVAPAYTSVHPSLPSFAADPQSWWAGPQAEYTTASNELEDERCEQFEGDIPGYINHFLNPDKKEGSRRRQSRGRRGTGEGGIRRGGTGERRARRPRGRTGGRGRGRGGLTQTVDVQEVGVSKLQMLFLQRWGTRVTRTGQGGGAAGRRLHLKTRELLKPAKSQRRRARGKVWEFGPNGDVLLCGGGGAGNAKRGRKNSTQQLNQDDLPAGRPQRATAKPTPSLSSFSSPPMRSYNVHTLSTSSPSLQLSPSDGLRSPAASFVSPASSLIHTTPVPPLAPPPHEEQPEHIDRLLEEVMMGLDILPNNNAALHPQPPVPAGFSTYASSSQTVEKQQGQVVSVATGGGGSSSANSEVPVLQQQGQGELNEMLEHFLLSFEQHVSCAGREEVEVGGCSPVRSSQITRQQQNEARRSQPRKASARSAAPPKHSEKPSGKVREPVKRRRKKKFKQYQFTLERKRVRRTPASLSDAKSKMVHDQGDKLQQMPVVKLERSGPLPVRVTLQGDSCQSLEVKSPAKATTRSPSVKNGSWSGKNLPDWWSTKTYPIRSRFKEQGSVPSPLEEPLVQKRPPSTVKPGGRRGRPRKNGQPLSLCNEESSRPPIQTEPVEPCGTEEPPETTQERHEEEITVQPQQEAAGPTKRGEKRGAESEEETSDDATVTKRVCFEQIQQPTSETLTSGSDSAAVEIEDVMDVETVSLASEGGCLQREDKPVWSETKQREIEEGSMDEEIESSDDTLIDLDGGEEEAIECRTAPTLSLYVKVKPYVSPASHSEVSQGSTGSWEDDVDVIGGSSPAPDPVIISWTEPSEDEKEGEDEDVDVVGDSAVVFATMSKGELVDRRYQTEVLLC